MSDLRSKTIRLAASLPAGDPTKKALLTAVLRSALSVGNGGENAGIRFHRFRPTVRVTDLTYAGKRGKKVDEFALYDLDMGQADPATEQLIERFMDGLPRQTSYSRALAEAKMLVLQARDKGWHGPKIQESQEMGVRVAPAGFGPIKIEGKHVSISADFNSFTVNDKDDQNNLPACIPRSKGSKGDVKQFFRWVTDNQSRIKGMTYSEVMRGMDAEGIDYHSYCRMD